LEARSLLLCEFVDLRHVPHDGVDVDLSELSLVPVVVSPRPQELMLCNARHEGENTPAAATEVLMPSVPAKAGRSRGSGDGLAELADIVRAHGAARAT